MAWFGASIIIGMKRSDGKGPITVYEDVILIEAETAEKAIQLAEEHGKIEENLDDKLTIDDHPAERMFAGVRKLIKIYRFGPGTTSENPFGTGTEVSYAKYEVPDEETLRRLGDGETLEILYVE